MYSVTIISTTLHGMDCIHHNFASKTVTAERRVTEAVRYQNGREFKVAGPATEKAQGPRIRGSQTVLTR